MKLEVVVYTSLGCGSGRAKHFYKGLGWREDADFASGADFRVVQLTPPGSPCSVIFGTGLTSAAPGSAQGLHLVMTDIEAIYAQRHATVSRTSENAQHFQGPMELLRHARRSGIYGYMREEFGGYSWV